jgi:hypothetical protein
LELINRYILQNYDELEIIKAQWYFIVGFGNYLKKLEMMTAAVWMIIVVSLPIVDLERN